MAVSYFLVFLLAAIPLFELITVIPLAIIGGLSPVPVAILGFLGNLLTILLLIVFVDKIKLLLRTRKQKRNVVTEVEGGGDHYTEGTELEQDSKKQKRARVLFDKYGLPGLTIFGPLLVGSHISAFMGMSFGSSRGLVTGWMIASLVIWTILSTVLANSGVSFLAPDLKENGFLLRIFR
ncbi:small multi-drug export protein [Cytobacillus massiliigabonensis]|uniref:small multi-drug export protein n=1 Tax=Cytobacillus massiliigabonensis TaxID=1871011 RepID=UPI000C85FFC7|nr:small multi-drug export protein [Cytobacillus massiliigabonensis]